jgi:glucuronate isomerase
MKLQPPKICIFDLDNPQHMTAANLMEEVSDLPIICPHTHVDAQQFVDPGNRFTDPSAMFVTGDHYIVRMLISQGVSFEQLGIQPKGIVNERQDPQAIWQVFCDYFHCFDGTPSGLWIENSLAMVFGINEKPNSHNAPHLFKAMQSALTTDEYSPRRLYDRFRIETLCTTDTAVDPLDSHQALHNSDWQGNVRPTFRADSLIHIGEPCWVDQVHALSRVSGIPIVDHKSYLRAIEERRTDFKMAGAVASDLSTRTPMTCRLSAREAEVIFQRALRGEASDDDIKGYCGHMVVEMARMSIEDGLVMQFRAGIYRNHHPWVLNTYGGDLGFDIPIRVEWTQNLKPLLDAFGMDTRLRLILFTLDESAFSREIAPLAGAYPAVKLGPPWWFLDSPHGILRYFSAVMETAGFDNTVGFNDDTRSLVSIPARHDLWRRMSALWLAQLVHHGQLDRASARHRMVDLAYGLAKKGYQLG